MGCSKGYGVRTAGAAMLFLAASSLVACSGGNNGGSGDAKAGSDTSAKNALSCAPDDFTVAAGSDPTELVFDWSMCDEDAVDHYRLEVNVDGASGYTVVAGAESVAATGYTHDVPVHLTDWVNALYRVVAVDAAGNEQSSHDLGLLSTVDSADVIGYFKAGNAGGSDEFGDGVALSADGSRLAVAAPREAGGSAGVNGPVTDTVPSAGAVYVFERADDGTWAQAAYVKASNPDNNDRFGSSVALSSDGNRLAVGASFEASDSTGIDGADNNLAPTAGAVYVFDRDTDGTWSQAAYVKADNTGGGDEFGSSVALSSDGGRLAVGATGEDSDATGIDGADNDDATDAGAVYVFDRSGDGTWSQAAYVKASNTDGGDWFGMDVALSSDGARLAVGAIGESGDATEVDGPDNDNEESAGAVYLFDRATNGTWSQAAYVKAGNAEEYDQFGTSVALSSDGSRLAVGATGEDSDSTGIDGADNGDAGSSGAVYVFDRADNGTWSQAAYVKAHNTGASDFFGQFLALSPDGGYLVVAALGDDSDATGIDGADNDNASGAGAAYVYRHDDGSGWEQIAYVKAKNTGELDQFGSGVALSSEGGRLAVGARREDGDATGINGAINDDSSISGAVYLY